MKKLLVILLAIGTLAVRAQNYKLNTGDSFPDIIYRDVVNTPFKQIDINALRNKKLYIINLWGTWCSPCIPEMTALAKLQNQYASQVQVIGVSDDPVAKLKKYAANKPSKIWLASDTASLLYRMLDVNSVGQCIILNASHQILGLYLTDSVSSKMVTALLNGKKVPSSGRTKDKAVQTGTDPFGVDSAMSSSFTFRSYMAGQQSMSKAPRYGKFGFRRISFFNMDLVSLFRVAYDLHTPKEMAYEFDKKKYVDYSDKSKLYCLDILVKPGQEDSLNLILQNRLQELSTIKARKENRTITVYLLKNNTQKQPTFSKSKLDHLVYGFSGNGFEGQGVTLTEFANLYLSNELEYPVIDETGMTGRYDIKTSNDMRDRQNILNAVDKLGLTLEKSERPVSVLVLYESPAGKQATAAMPFK